MIFVFALCERKSENIETESTMLPQAKSSCIAGDRVTPVNEGYIKRLTVANGLWPAPAIPEAA
jgi:hypothetical protein